MSRREKDFSTGCSVVAVERGEDVLVQFGPVLLFGAGGRAVEVMRDRAIGLPPLTSVLARRLMEEILAVEEEHADELSDLLQKNQFLQQIGISFHIVIP